MPIFLSESQRARILGDDASPRVHEFLHALSRRVARRAASPGLLSGQETADWWRPVAEFVSDAAMLHALTPSEATARWLRDVVMSVVRRPVDDWAGPAYRNPAVLEDGGRIGGLETAHFCWAVATALDLAGDVLTEAERDESRGVLRDRGAKMCLAWLGRRHHVANWWCVLTAGLSAAAAVLDDTALLDRSMEELAGCADVLQPDGTYAESLQYGNYALYALMIATEALAGRGRPALEVAPVARRMGYVQWAAASYLYSKSAAGWGDGPRPRSLNFNDSGALFKPTADVLLNLAVRGAGVDPARAGLARWLFDVTYGGHLLQGPDDQASFGLRTDWGFLTLPFLVDAPPPLSPQETGLDPLQAFDCGDTVARDGWGGRTVVAFHGAGGPMYGPGHTHFDLNSVIVVHNRERLLTDAGHSCYRNSLRELELSSHYHNTCVFVAEGGEAISQHGPARRVRERGRVSDPVVRGGHRLLASGLDDVRAFGGEAAGVYGPPISRFLRVVLLCGTHVVFVVDACAADVPVRTTWNWMLNNRAGGLDYDVRGDRFTACRGDAGMLAVSGSGGHASYRFGHVNDAYHCLPDQVGEGRPGSAVIVTWTTPHAAHEGFFVHAFVLDTPGRVGRWDVTGEAGRWSVIAPGSCEHWSLDASADRVALHAGHAGRGYVAAAGEGDAPWTLTRA